MKHDDHLIFEAYKSKKLLKEFDASKDWPARDEQGKPRARTADEIRTGFQDALGRSAAKRLTGSGSESKESVDFVEKADELVQDLSNRYGASTAAKILKLAFRQFHGENEEQMLLFPDPKPAKRAPKPDYHASMADVECIDHPEKCVP